MLSQLEIHIVHISVIFKTFNNLFIIEIYFLIMCIIQKTYIYIFHLNFFFLPKLKYFFFIPKFVSKIILNLCILLFFIYWKSKNVCFYTFSLAEINF